MALTSSVFCPLRSEEALAVRRELAATQAKLNDAHAENKRQQNEAMATHQQFVATYGELKEKLEGQPMLPCPPQSQPPDCWCGNARSHRV